MIREGQFTLRALFIATAFVALACVAVRYIVSPFAEDAERLAAWLTLPVLLGGAVGSIRGQLRAWLAYGAAIAIAFIALIWLPPLVGF